MGAHQGNKMHKQKQSITSSKLIKKHSTKENKL